jgi:hypothetical protein
LHPSGVTAVGKKLFKLRPSCHLGAIWGAGVRTERGFVI